MRNPNVKYAIGIIYVGIFCVVGRRKMEMNVKVQAVIVTYNRKELLCECIESVLSQTVLVDRVIIIDNCSTDGTREYLCNKGMIGNPLIHYVQLPKNIGGAGGFYEGMKIASDSGSDWVWIMDDDVLPSKDALEKLMNARKKIQGEISFLASAVRGKNGEAMNVPKIERKQFQEYVDWYQYLESGIVKIVKATFVSLLINRKAIERCGLPWKKFFLWGDDSEYTQRIIRDFAPAYMVGDSLVVHLRSSAEALSLVKEKNKQRIPMYFYYYRNNLIGFWEYEGFLYRFLCVGKLVYDFFMVLFMGKYKMRKMQVIVKAFFSFLFGTYGRKEFRNRSEL